MQKNSKSGAKIIDLDFYRKFQVILPIHPDILSEDQPQQSKKPQYHYLRRRKRLFELENKEK